MAATNGNGRRFLPVLVFLPSFFSVDLRLINTQSTTIYHHALLNVIALEVLFLHVANS